MLEPRFYPRNFGKYVLQRQLAVGGMAEIYLARANGPAGFEKECVIKRILSRFASDEQFIRMFLDEARIAARLSHPNIVQIYDLGQEGADFFIAMEYVAGVDLEQIIDAEKARGGRVPIPIALRIAAGAADGLDHAHKALDMRGQPLGLVHRDVSPSNIMVSFDGIAKVLDFGIAKATPTKVRTEVGIIKGKLPYMSPEQVEGQPLDGRSDVFALGTLIYELTVGKRPFDGNSAGEVTLQVLKNEPRPAVLTVRGYPDALSAILAKTHNKRRTERYASARELQRALENYLAESRAPSSTHDVAAYLAELFPGLRERTVESDAEAASSAIKEAGAPTIPVLLEKRSISSPAILAPQGTPTHPEGFKLTPARWPGAVLGAAPGAVAQEMDGAPTQPERVAAPAHRSETPGRGSVPTELDGDVPMVMGDLSSNQLGNYDDVRRNLGGSNFGTVAVIGALVLSVALGFWWLRGRSSSAAPPRVTPTTTAAPVTPPAIPKVMPGVEPAPPVPVPAIAATPDVAAPTSPIVKPAPKPAAHPHTTTKPHHHTDETRALPHLPGVPPPDDGQP